LTLVNAARTDAGCSALTGSAGLTDRAEQQSTDMAEAGTLGAPRAAAGRTSVVAHGPADADAAVAGWLADTSARAALLDCDRTSLGAGEGTGAGGPWWTAVLA